MWTKHHPTEDTLDEYRLKRLDSFRTVAVENHLLWCQECREIVRETNALVQLLARVEGQPEYA